MNRNYEPTILERNRRVFSGLADESTAKFEASENATAIDAWKAIEADVADYALDTVSGSLTAKAVDESGNLSDVSQPYASDKKRLLLKKVSGIWTPRKLVGAGWKLPNITACVQSLKELPFPCVKARAVNDGDLVGFTFDIGGGDIGGEPVQRYLNAFISNKPNVMHSFFTSAENFFCMNAFFFHLNISDIGFRIGHASPNEMQEYFAFVVDLRQRMVGHSERVEQYLSGMTNRIVNAEEQATVIEAAYPDPEIPNSVKLTDEKFEKALAEMKAENVHMPVLATLNESAQKYMQGVERQRVRRDLAEQSLVTYEDTGRPFPGTAYAVYQAITEVSTHRTGRGNIGDSVYAGERQTEIMRASEAIAQLVAV